VVAGFYAEVIALGLHADAGPLAWRRNCMLVLTQPSDGTRRFNVHGLPRIYGHNVVRAEVNMDGWHVKEMSRSLLK
jgi:hypothetical protein